MYSVSVPKSIKRSRIYSKTKVLDENSTTKKKKSKQKSNKKSTEMDEIVSKFNLNEADLVEKLQAENTRLNQMMNEKDDRIKELERLN